MKFSLYIAKRYLFSKSSNNAINIITLFATLGVVVGTLVLFIVLSGFSGLRTFSIGLLSVSDPDITISSKKGKSFMFNDKIHSILEEEKDIISFSKVIEERAFFDFNNKTHIAYIKGVDTNYVKVNNMDKTVYIGTWLDEKIPNGAVIGNQISRTLSVGVFEFLEPLRIYVPKPGKGYITNPKNAFNHIDTQPIGIFSISEDIDKKYTFVSLELAQILLNYSSNQISAVELSLSNYDNKEIVIENLKNKLGPDLKFETREQQNAVFYKMLNSENLFAYFIFTLILIIALFNVVGSIIMMILDKKENLKTFYNLGATIKSIKRIFVLQGFLLTIFGLSVGLTLGITIVYMQKKYSLFMITANLPYPVEIQISNIVLVIVTIIILGYLASVIASSRISKKLVE